MSDRAILTAVIIILSFVLISTLCVCTTSCAKLIDTTYEEVEVTIIDSYHRAAYMTPMCVGKTITFQHHPARWYIYVTYNGEQYDISGSDTYHAYKNRIGETVMGTLKTNTYDDGSIYLDITEIYDKEN